MMRKGLLVKWRTGHALEKAILWEILLPFLYGFVLLKVSETFECTSETMAQQQQGGPMGQRRLESTSGELLYAGANMIY